MQLSDVGLKLIQEFESYMIALPDGGCKSYQCKVGTRNGKPVYDGKWTIGFGVTEGIVEGMVWTRAQADEAFMRELAKHQAAVTRLVTVELNQNMYDALCSFLFNCGIGAFQGSTLRAKLNAGDYAGAALQFSRWNKSQGLVVSGLTRRRAAEAALFSKPVEAPPEPTMPQAVDPPAPAPEGSRKVMVANTGAVSAVSTGAAIAAINVSDTFQYGTQALNLVKEHGTSSVLIGLFAVAAAFAAIKHFTLQDHAEGRYIPSGDSK